jgi:hypothetical protein
MKPLRKFLLILFFVSLSGAISLFLYFYFSPERPKPLYSQDIIQLSDDFDIHFTRKGIAVSSPHTVFYSPEGAEIEPPFAAEDFINLPLGFSINSSTDNYLLINERYIFSTRETPFEMIWRSSDWIIRDIIEMDGTLLLVLKDQDNFLVPHIFDPATKELTSLQGLVGSFFLDAAICDESGFFSILAFSDEGLFPSARVFHFDNKASLYAALTQRDSLYFNIYKMQSAFVLVGTNRIICYNTDGSKNWALDIPNAYRHSKVLAGDYIWLYFYYSPTGFSNALRISKDASKEWFDLPHGLSSIQSYLDGLIAVLNHDEIIVLNSLGELTARFKPGIDIDKMYWDKYLADYIYLLDRFGRLFAYTLSNPSEEESQ